MSRFWRVVPVIVVTALMSTQPGVSSSSIIAELKSLKTLRLSISVEDPRESRSDWRAAASEQVAAIRAQLAAEGVSLERALALPLLRIRISVVPMGDSAFYRVEVLVLDALAVSGGKAPRYAAVWDSHFGGVVRTDELEREVLETINFLTGELANAISSARSVK